VTVDGEVLVSSGGGGATVESAEQKVCNALNATYTDFVYYFRTNDIEGLRTCLSSTFTGEIFVWSEGDDIADLGAYTNITGDHVKEIEEKGSLIFSIELGKWSYTASAYETAGYLTFTIIPENGGFKVSDYYLLANEA